MGNQSSELAQLHLVEFVPTGHKEESAKPLEDEWEPGKAGHGVFKVFKECSKRLNPARGSEGKRNCCC